MRGSLKGRDSREKCCRLTFKSHQQDMTGHRWLHWKFILLLQGHVKRNSNCQKRSCWNNEITLGWPEQQSYFLSERNKFNIHLTTLGEKKIFVIMFTPGQVASNRALSDVPTNFFYGINNWWFFYWILKEGGKHSNYKIHETLAIAASVRKYLKTRKFGVKSIQSFISSVKG